MSVHDERLKEHRQAQWYVTLLGRCLAETSNPEEAAMAARLAFDWQPEPPFDFKFVIKPSRAQVSAAPPPPPDGLTDEEKERNRAEMRPMLAALDEICERTRREADENPLLRDAITKAKDWQREVQEAAEQERERQSPERDAALSLTSDSKIETLIAKLTEAVTAITARPIIVNMPSRPKRIIVQHSDGTQSTIEPSGDVSPRSIIFRQNADGTSTAEESSAESN